MNQSTEMEGKRDKERQQEIIHQEQKSNTSNKRIYMQFPHE